MFHSKELDLIHSIQAIRHPILDPFFLFLNFFDREIFFLLLIPTVWFALNWKVGIKFFYALTFNYLINYLLKVFFAHPRPLHLDPSVGMITLSGYGFPSGAAQTAVFLTGFTLLYFKGKWKWALALSYFILISFSRLYLGAHFLSDVLGGWIFGAAFFSLLLLARPLEKKLENWSTFSLFLLSQLAPLLIFTLSKRELPLCLVGSGIGFGLTISYAKGLLLEDASKVGDRVQRVIVGTFSTLLIFVLGFYCFAEQSIIGQTVPFFLMGLNLGLFGNLLLSFFQSKNSLEEKKHPFRRRDV